MAVTVPLSSSSPNVAMKPLVKPVPCIQPTTVRTVQFDETQNVEYANTELCAEDCARNWYTPLDYQQIKNAAHAQGKQIWMRERKVEHMHDSYKNVLLRVYDACCEATQETEDLLSDHDLAVFTMFIGKSYSRTGLEKMCIREIAHDRRYRRGQMVDMIRAVQASSMDSSHYTRTELLRLTSESASRTSRLFARYMGLALATSLEE